MIIQLKFNYSILYYNNQSLLIDDILNVIYITTFEGTVL